MNATLLAAVKLGDQIERFGSYAGYAAVLGLAVLAMLYFAQALDLPRLREVQHRQHAEADDRGVAGV
ncbi:MAG: hypothetical protein QOI73_2913 [Solirubrobacteraceae bacterium]|nr:hypothetical protein [Solirubrobacteraceae bacterium]